MPLHNATYKKTSKVKDQKKCRALLKSNNTQTVCLPPPTWAELFFGGLHSCTKSHAPPQARALEVDQRGPKPFCQAFRYDLQKLPVHYVRSPRYVRALIIPTAALVYTKRGGREEQRYSLRYLIS